MNSPNSSYGTPALHVLLAEDGAVNQRLAVELLKQFGHVVTVVGNGRQAVEALRHDVFDVLLMDVEMPELDGLSATRLIRADERKRESRLPIVAVTANDNRNECIAAGMDAYLRKPLKAEELHETLGQVVSKPAA